MSEIVEMSNAALILIAKENLIFSDAKSHMICELADRLEAAEKKIEELYRTRKLRTIILDEKNEL